MSYDIELCYEDVQAEVKNHQEGGTYQVGGTKKASLNLTYNYSWFYHRFLDDGEGIRWMYGKTGKETISRLADAVEELGVKQYKDYWAPTPGNAGYALSILLEWAKQHPTAVWDGD